MSKTLQVAELRSQISEVLDDVEERGLTVEVSRRGRPVARLTPIQSRILVDPFALKKFCDSHEVSRLYLFGSSLRDDFRPDSDVDLIYETEKRMKFSEICDMEDELARLFDREIDLVEMNMVRSMTNKFLRESILSGARILHGH